VRRRVLPLLALALALAAAPAFAAEPQTTLPDIEDEVMCVVCGVVLEHAIDAPQALQERDLIRRLIAQGLTKDEIKDRLVDEYGEEVLSIPGDSGFDLAAWLVPGAAIVLAGGAIVVGLRRWRRADRRDKASAPDEQLDSAENEQLDADLARYEL
jgi:cytochrome c-type biogenesis protein CcmH/NrfF